MRIPGPKGMSGMSAVDVVIPTYHPDAKLGQLFSRLCRQSVLPGKILVVNTLDDTGAQDQQDQMIRAMMDSAMSGLGDERPELVLWHIAKDEFDHAGTRDEAIRKSSAPYVLLMTDDAMPADRYLIEHLLDAFSNADIAAAYARQLPRQNANRIERMTRQFNYPDSSFVKGIEDEQRLGIKTYFCSDVCAMYRRVDYDRLGGFSRPAIFNEDMVFVHRAMKDGKKVAYRADAKVYHSHNYGGLAQLHRNFDNGVSQAMHPEVFEGISSENEGKKMLAGQMRELLSHGRIISAVSLIWISGCKYAGFFLGKRYRRLPRRLVMKLTSNQSFWAHLS